MEVPDDLKADSGLKTHVRDAVRPQLEFIKTSLKDGVSEAAIHRYLIKHGHKVGSRSGFGAALKYLLKEEQSVGVVGVPAERSSLTAAPVLPHSANPAAIAATAVTIDAGSAGSAEASLPVHVPANTSYGDDRHGYAWGTP